MLSAAAGGTTYSYAYDGDGNRVSKKQNGSFSNTYVWDPNASLAQLAMERGASRSELRRYLYDGDLLQMGVGAAESCGVRKAIAAPSVMGALNQGFASPGCGLGVAGK